MKKELKNTINAAKIIAPIIGSRDSIDRLRKAVINAKSKLVDLDFKDVEFISRSAAHELLIMKEDLRRRLLRQKKEVAYTNTNKDVTEMFRIVAANRAVPKTVKPKDKLERVDIVSLFHDVRSEKSGI